jgi:hypothetical protein
MSTPCRILGNNAGILALAATIVAVSISLTHNEYAVAATTKKSADRIYCERKAGGDYRRLKICMSYMTNMRSPKRQQLPPSVKKRLSELTGSEPPSIKGKSASGYAFISDICFGLYRGRFQSVRAHKSFATAKRERMEVCGAGYAWPTIAKAKSVALEQCREQAKRNKLDVAACNVIEVH